MRILISAFLGFLFLLSSSFSFADPGKFSCQLLQEQNVLDHIDVTEGSEAKLMTTLENPSAIYLVNLFYLKATDQAPAKFKVDFSALASKPVETNFRLYTSSVTVGASAEFLDFELESTLTVHCNKN